MVRQSRCGKSVGDCDACGQLLFLEGTLIDQTNTTRHTAAPLIGAHRNCQWTLVQLATVRSGLRARLVERSRDWTLPATATLIGPTCARLSLGKVDPIAALRPARSAHARRGAGTAVGATRHTHNTRGHG